MGLDEEKKITREKINQKTLTDDGLSSEERKSQILKEISLLVKESNDDLYSNLAIQRDITGELLELKKVYKESNQNLKGSISLSRQVENALKDSVNSGKNLDQIERARNKNANTALQIVQQIKVVSKSVTGTNQEILDNAINFSKAKQEQIKDELTHNALLNERTSLLNQLEENQNRSRDIELEIKKLREDNINSEGAKLDIANNIVENLKKETTSLSDNNSILNSSKLTVEEQLSKSRENLDISTKKLRIQSDILPIEEKEALLLAAMIQNLSEANSKLVEQEQHLLKIQKAMGLSGQAIKVVNKLFGGQLNMLNDVKKHSEKRISDLIDQKKQHNLTNGLVKGQKGYIEENASKMEGFAIQVGEAGKALRNNLTDPLIYIATAITYDKEINKLSKQLATTAKQTREIRQELGGMAADFGRLGISSKELTTSAIMLNQQFGTAFSPDTGAFKELIGDVSVLTKMMGLSEEAAAGFARASISSGQSVEDIKLESLGVITALEQQSGILLDNVAILETSGKVSGQLRAQLGDSVQEIIKAEAAAQQLGMTLQSVASAADNLLNFETSIGNELSAELLIGKQLNLEKARLAALTGNYKTLTEEINKNVGDFSDFQDLNVLQQRALADAVGMTVDGLSDQLMAKEDLSVLAQEARALGDEEKAQALERRDIEQKFADILTDVKQIFVDLVGGPVGDLLRGIGFILEKIVLVTKFLSKASGGLTDMVIQIYVAVRLFKGLVSLVRNYKLTVIAINSWKKKQLLLDKLGNAEQVKRNTLLGSERLHRAAIWSMEKMGLITKRQGTMIKTREQMLNKTAITDTAAKNFYENATLGATLKRNIAKQYGILLGKLGLGTQQAKVTQKGIEISQQGTSNILEAQGNSLKNTGLLTKMKESIISVGEITRTLALNSLKTIGNLLGITSLNTKVAEGAAETIITASKVTQGAAMGGIISKGIAYLGVLIAQATAALVGASALTLGIGTIGIIAAAAGGIVYLASKTKVGDASMKPGLPVVGTTNERGQYDLSVGTPNDSIVMAPNAVDMADNFETLKKQKTSIINQAPPVQNNKVMEEKLDKLNNTLLMVAEKTGNVQAYVVDDATSIPSLTDYSRNYTDGAISPISSIA